MHDSLLSHIANNFISEYENVANSSVSYLLNRYEAAREVLRQVLDVDSVPNNYITELSTKSNGRPDVTGLDIDGNKSVIIEGKFWANLTDNQPANYLQELTTDGKLLFLAPDKRIAPLKVDIQNRLGGVDDVSQIVICSWSKFLDLIDIENNKNHDHHLASDLIQIKQLCQRMDEEGMPPLSMSDLDPMNGRRAWQFADLIDECNSLLRRWEHSNFKGLNTTPRKGEYGFYFRGHDILCYLSYSYYDWYSEDSQTPIWLAIHSRREPYHKKIYPLLNRFDPEHSYHEGNKDKLGIMLKTGMDKDQIVKHTVNTVKKVIEFIHAELAATETSES